MSFKGRCFKGNCIQSKKVSSPQLRQYDLPIYNPYLEAWEYKIFELYPSIILMACNEVLCPLPTKNKNKKR